MWSNTLSRTGVRLQHQLDCQAVSVSNECCRGQRGLKLEACFGHLSFLHMHEKEEYRVGTHITEMHVNTSSKHLMLLALSFILQN